MAASAASRVETVRDVASLRARLAEWRRAGETIGLVPTMGALHAGHISLVHEAQKRARRVVMSIFVNPAQFAPSEDFCSYPRAFEADSAKFAAAEGDLLFAPSVAEMYGQGFVTMLAMTGPATAGLEDRFRPGHFAGVATIV
ncbi:MAG: pantoate--beta-alanine ligase, partial [Methylocella sp.]